MAIIKKKLPGSLKGKRHSYFEKTEQILDMAINNFLMITPGFFFFKKNNSD
jgi:hypothetical protein